MLNSNEMVSQKLGDIVCEEKTSGARKSVGWWFQPTGKCIRDAETSYRPETRLRCADET